MGVEDREIRPAGQYEWQQIIRRARFGGIVKGSGRTGKDGRVTKGGVSGTLFTAVALTFATYADPDGTDVYPGDATIAVDLETTIKAVRTVRQTLVSLGLLQLVRRRTPGHGDEYRLTLSSDLLDAVEVLTPAQHKIIAQRLRDTARGKPGGSGGPPETAAPGGPVDPPHEPQTDTPGWSGGPPENDSGWSGGPAPGGPPDPHTNHYRTTTTTNHPGDNVRTAVTGPRARETAQTPIPAADVAERLPGRCPHGLTSRRRPDGRPSCAICRRGQPTHIRLAETA